MVAGSRCPSTVTGDFLIVSGFWPESSLVFRLFKPLPMTHIAAVVGHGVDENGWPYWRLKNSWGVDWGERGYLRIVKDVGHCGIATHIAIPTCERVEE